MSVVTLTIKSDIFFKEGLELLLDDLEDINIDESNPNLVDNLQKIVTSLQGYEQDYVESREEDICSTCTCNELQKCECPSDKALNDCSETKENYEALNKLKGKVLEKIDTTLEAKSITSDEK